MSASVTPEALPERGTTGGFGAALSLLQRVPTKHVLYIAALMLVPLILAQPLRNAGELLNDPDICWHLANARNLLATGHFVRQELFSYSVAGMPWISPEWLSEIPYWLGFKWLHFTGIFLVTWLGLSANLGVLYWRSVRKSGSATISFWSTALAFTLMTVNSGPRTIILAYLALQAELAILEAFESGNRRLVWLLPPLFCIWVNLHGSWLIGLGLFVLYCACGLFTVKKGVFNQLARKREDNWALLIALIASVALLFVNPYGWSMVYNPLDMMLHQSLNIANVQEWQPLNLASMVGKCTLLTVLLVLGANMLRRREWKVYEFAFVLFAWFAAFEHVRFTFLAAVVVTPFLALDLKRALSDEKLAAGQWTPVRHLALTAMVVWAIVHSMPSEQRLEQAQREIRPLRLIGMIQPNWRVLNSIELGGVLDLEGKSSFIDTRFDTFEHHGILADFLATVNVNRPLENLARYRIDHVLVREDTPLAYLLLHANGWQERAREGQGSNTYVLLERAGPDTPQAARP